MKPIYLECNAFGPFADKVTFPLEQICGGVFLIHGATGAGKTTIGELFYKKLKAQYSNAVFGQPRGK